MPSTGQITRLLAEVRAGNRVAEEQLIPLVYGELHRLAAAYMRREREDHTLQATALVHEAYIKLLPQRESWQNRAHFIGVAAHQMRRILVDYARKRGSERRECEANKLQLDEALVIKLLVQFVRWHERGCGHCGLRHAKRCSTQRENGNKLQAAFSCAPGSATMITPCSTRTG